MLLRLNRWKGFQLVGPYATEEQKLELKVQEIDERIVRSQCGLVVVFQQQYEDEPIGLL